MLEELTQTPGVPGYESEVASALMGWMEGVAEPTYDGLGSVIFSHQGAAESPRIMLAGHMDEVGFMVRHITEEGFIKFLPLGGWWDQVLLGQRVVIRTCRGELTGVIGSKPPHILPREKRDKLVKLKDMFIDVGARDRENAEQMGVRVGDPIIPFSPFATMGDGDLLLSKAWDDRVGCALFVDLLHRLVNEDHPNSVYGVGTVQEEVGLRGATTSVEMVKPDVGIALEVSIAGDVPGVEPDEATDELGGGPSLLFYDNSMIPNLKLRDLVVEVAESEGIPLQVSVMSGGGTDAGRIHIHRSGVPSVVLGVPTRYIHAHAGILSIADYEQTVDLLTALMKVLDGDTVGSLRSF
ncbi:MAG: M42 family metallopeptidase [Bacillota bacterium]